MSACEKSLRVLEEILLVFGGWENFEMKKPHLLGALRQLLLSPESRCWNIASLQISIERVPMRKPRHSVHGRICVLHGRGRSFLVRSSRRCLIVGSASYSTLWRSAHIVRTNKRGTRICKTHPDFLEVGVDTFNHLLPLTTTLPFPRAILILARTRCQAQWALQNFQGSRYAEASSSIHRLVDCMYTPHISVCRASRNHLVSQM